MEKEICLVLSLLVDVRIVGHGYLGVSSLIDRGSSMRSRSSRVSGQCTRVLPYLLCYNVFTSPSLEYIVRFFIFDIGDSVPKGYSQGISQLYDGTGESGTLTTHLGLSPSRIRPVETVGHGNKPHPSITVLLTPGYFGTIFC